MHAIGGKRLEKKRVILNAPSEKGRLYNESYNSNVVHDLQTNLNIITCSRQVHFISLLFINTLHYKEVILVKQEENFLAICMCFGIHLNKLLPPGKGVMVASFLWRNSYFSWVG